MSGEWLFHRGLHAKARRLTLLAFIVVVCAVSLCLCGYIKAADEIRPPAKSPPQGKVPRGPQDTGFNSSGYKICKVVRIERSLNALGIAALFGKTNKVGKYVELPKELDSSQKGEHFIVTWKYSGKKSPRETLLKFECKFFNEENVHTMSREYPGLKRGRRRLLIENTGEDYRRLGRIEYWRVTVFADGELVARKESFLWPIFGGEGKTASTQTGRLTSAVTSP